MKPINKWIATLILMSSLASLGHAQSSLTNGLVLYYPFNGNANDASGNGNNGVVQGATLTSDRFGVPNHAYKFNGTSSAILFPETIFGPTVQGFSVSAWVTTDAGNYSNDQVIMEKSAKEGQFTLEINAGKVFFGPKLTVAPQWFTTGATVPTNATSQFVGVYRRGQQVEFYINGALASVYATPNADLWVDTSGYPLDSAIGIYDYTPGSSEAFRGIIDSVRIYNRALSTNEVQQLYAYESIPLATVKKAVQPSFSNLFLGTNYQLQVSTDLVTWTNYGATFTATNSVMDYPGYFDVDNWNGLFFRIQGP